MVCPKCHTEIPEGYLYCPKCGEEIIIVSDFDITLEDNIDVGAVVNTTELPDIGNVVDNSPTQEISLNLQQDNEVDDEIPKKYPRDDKENASLRTIKIKRAIILVSVIGVLLIGLVVYISVVVSRYYSYDEQYSEALQLYSERNFEEALKTAKHAVELEETDNKASILLADVYCSMNNYDAANAVLFELLNRYPDDIGIYDRIVKVYEDEGNFEGIHELIVNSNNDRLLNKYDAYISEPPVFAKESGVYNQEDVFEIAAEGNGTIYYSLDESIPGESSLEYTDPIALDTGTTTITAVYVNEKGIVSEPASVTYEIELAVPTEPILSVSSGEYTIPQLIEVENESSGVNVYYTDNGREPSTGSYVYSMPILMPIGKSTYKFIAIDGEGTSSSVTELKVNLTMEATVDKAAAEYAISFQLMSLGEDITDKLYKADLGYSDQTGVYYIIDEYFGADITGRRFAVNADTGELFRFGMDEANKAYVLTAL